MAKKRSTATRRADSQAASARAAAIRREQERKERRRRSLVVTAVVVVVLVLIGAIAYGVQSSRDTSTGSAASASGAIPSGTVGRYGVPAGPGSAPVKAVIYEDFICPYCGAFEAASRDTLQKDIDQGKLQIQYHVLNFLDRSSSTKYSTRAANALGVVLDSAGPEVAKKFHDLLFENQPQEGSAGLSDSQLVAYAVQAGAKRSEVENAIKNGKFDTWVVKGTDQASKAHVTGTPTVRIDGRDLPVNSPQDLVAQIQKVVDAGGKQ
jgi:protein-disulfide isomerase